MEIGYKLRKNLESVYRRIDEVVARDRASSTRRRGGAAAQSLLDPFEELPSIPQTTLEKIDEIERQLKAHASGEIVARLCDFVRRAPAQEVGRIRARAFARRHRFDHRDVLRACLYGAKLGLFVMLWDVICPSCRIPSNIVESLEALRAHDHCDACDLDFELDFARSVEIIFRVAPDLRPSELGTFCIGGPGHTPHVVLQIRLDPGERFEVDLMLDEGDYRVVGRHLPVSWGFSVRRGAALRHWELSVTAGPGRAESASPDPSEDTPVMSAVPRTQRVIDAGRQRIVLCNDTDAELVARIEREGERVDAITAAEAAATPAFRELFPSEVLAPGHLISIGRVSLLLADADVWNADDEPSAFARLTELARVVGDTVQRGGGTVIKIHGEGVMAAFNSAEDAARAALELVQSQPADLRAAVHSGPAMVTSINDRLDYFGRVVRQTDELLRATQPGCASISEAAYAEAHVGAMLASAPSRGMIATDEIVGQILRPSVQAEQHHPEASRSVQAL